MDSSMEMDSDLEIDADSEMEIEQGSTCRLGNDFQIWTWKRTWIETEVHM